MQSVLSLASFCFYLCSFQEAVEVMGLDQMPTVVEPVQGFKPSCPAFFHPAHVLLAHLIIKHGKYPNVFIFCYCHFLFFYISGWVGKMFCILVAHGVSVHQSTLPTEQGQHVAPAPTYLCWPVCCTLLGKDNPSPTQDWSWCLWSSFQRGFVSFFRLFLWSNSCTDEPIKKVNQTSPNWILHRTHS